MQIQGERGGDGVFACVWLQQDKVGVLERPSVSGPQVLLMLKSPRGYWNWRVFAKQSGKLRK